MQSPCFTDLTPAYHSSSVKYWPHVAHWAHYNGIVYHLYTELLIECRETIIMWRILKKKKKLLELQEKCDILGNKLILLFAKT